MKDFLDIQRDHAELLNDVIKTNNKDGLIFFSTNYTKFVLDAANINAASVKDINRQPRRLILKEVKTQLL